MATTRGRHLVTYGRYTGQESHEERQKLAANPPDILLTNYVMLELIMTRQNPTDLAMVESAKGLRFLVLDELHTYRGRQGADVAMLVRRVRQRLNPDLQCIGTSATMASEGTAEDRNTVVAAIASRLFGAPVPPRNIITETLERVTPAEVATDKTTLANASRHGVPHCPDYDALRRHPLAAWIEMQLGLEQEDGREYGKLANASRHGVPHHPDYDALPSHPLAAWVEMQWRLEQEGGREHGKLVRISKPRTLRQAAHQLSRESAVEVAECEHYLTQFLLLAYRTRSPQTGHSLFAFRLHQFIAGAGDLYGTLEPPDVRYLTLNGQQYKPGERDKLLFTMSFCRECGQEYYPVWATMAARQPVQFAPRQVSERSHEDDDVQFDYFMPDTAGMFDANDVENGIYPEDWIDFSAVPPRVKRHFHPYRPMAVSVQTTGAVGAGMPGWFMPRTFRFCLHCGVAYAGSMRSDLTKLSSLSSEGRSSATTVLAFSALRYLLDETHQLDARTRKLLAFTDNRQDASLQAGHFNDFIQILLLRGALLAAASPEHRVALAHELLDLMRRHLCLKTIYLDRHYQEQIRNRSFAMLKEPWALTEDERLFSAPVMVPRPQTRSADAETFTFHISYRSAFGRRMQRRQAWGEDNPHYPSRFPEAVYNALIDAMLGALSTYGLVEPVDLEDALTGYRIDASIIEWRVGEPQTAETANPFFRHLYENVAALLASGDTFLHQLEAREHTAQVDSETREEREQRFRQAQLPVLFCSPTMELGVDIASLNTVYMRNVPPTPANYAQRSGRAGRGGQPALVITYCAAKSPHDQYFFQDPTRMVAGVVNAPTIDLANEELIRNHLHAVWLAETGEQLPRSVKDLLDLSQDPELPVRADIDASLASRSARERAARHSLAILATLEDELKPERAPWYGEAWLDSVMVGAHRTFTDAFERWRSLFRATTRQMHEAHTVQMNHAVGEKERKEAQQRYNEARVQLNLLLENRPTLNSDFYTYRYLASQGFLPGYNFPRLPLLAFIPARREKIGRDSFLSRSRFLGLSEFGPQSIIYHEGSTYRVKKVMLGIHDEDSVTTSAQLPVRRARLCPTCGYAHFDSEKDYERCVNCQARLDGGRTLLSLYRIEQVSTRRATHITSDEEERQRQGYEMVTTLRYALANGQPQCASVLYSDADTPLLEMRYGSAATLWRVNLGWRRRQDKSIYGFNIDVTTGEWSKDAQAPVDPDDTPSQENRAVQRIIPYVEDRKNCLVIQPQLPLDAAAMMTLQYALKRGIEAVFQLESSELAAEALPDPERRNAILLYESAEGGAGVLTRLASDLRTLQIVAQRALAICHYDSVSGQWTGPQDLTNTDAECEAGCYKCLLSYTNQLEHQTIDRRHPAVLDLLCRLTHCEGVRGAFGKTAEELFEALSNLSLSSLEQAWLAALRQHGYHLPDKAQPRLADYGTQADFGYASVPALIYIDGPHHDTAHRRQIDATINRRLEEAGYTVVRFPKERDAWPAIFASHAFVFGTCKP